MSAVGMVSPVGANAVQTFTSVRAAIRRMQEHPAIYHCLPGDARLDPATPLVASAIAHLDTTARREQRPAEWLAFLAAQAFRELEWRGRIPRAGPARLGVFLAVPGRPGLGPEAKEEIAYHFHNYAERDRIAELQIVFGGHTAALGLAEQAVAMLRDRRVDLAAVGGADSYLFASWLEALDRDWRLLSERNTDGFQPGEAAAFFLLEPAASARKRGAAPAAVLRLLANGKVEDAPGQTNTGAELAAVLERVLPPGPSPLLVCDLNGESSRTREWAFALARLGKKLEAGYLLETPALALGDIGTASGAALVVLAVQYLARKHPTHPGAVVWSASDDGQRWSGWLERA